MALFGFVINFTNGATDYAIVSAADSLLAEKGIVNTLEDSGAASFDTVEHYDAEAIVREQYNYCAILSSQFGGGSDE